ncbi:MAG: lipid-A-disaccharide synthase [Chitinophagaceae bacterium]|nr:lipid-A-disaccharide synthase [Chitinophagaceae bacterium]
MKYYLIAGEASGDLHGSNLVRELVKQDPSAAIRCWGGDLMQEAGGELVKHYRDLAFMGFAEVIKNLPTIFRNLRFCKEDILSWKPDVLILIDYPGFNLRIAKWAKQQGLKVVYYISPQVWAWKENRVKSMKTCIDKMLVILPFEKDYYEKKWDWPVEYVGHPLVEVIDRFRGQPVKLEIPGDADKPIIALLPGSRKQEILKKLPVMLEVTRAYPNYRFVVARAPGLDTSFYEEMLRPYDNVYAVSNATYALLNKSKAALVTSGTATLETALFGVPEVVCYKGSYLSYQIGKRLVKVKFISLVNLILDKLVVKELIQDELNTTRLQAELDILLTNEEQQAQVQQDYKALHQLLGRGGNASQQAARSIVDFLQHPSAK